MDENEPGPPRRPGTRWLIAAVGLVVIAAAVIVVLVTGDSREPAGSSPAPTVTVTRTGPTVTISTPQVPVTSPTPGVTSKPTAPARRVFRYQPVWPFVSESKAAEWQRAYRSGGQQPWHLDPERTALSFTQGFLGFGEIDRVTSRSVRGDEAYIGVGYRADTGATFVAAVVHLARIGQGNDAPWEVVGTRDSDLTLTVPRYGAAVGSPLTVGGRITGVDEAIRVEVRQASSAAPLGTLCCVPAGGERTPWSARVTFRAPTDPVVVIVASAGGHVEGVERFAITAGRTVD